MQQGLRQELHVELACEDADLTGDLSRGQIAVESHLAGEAESAFHRAANLRGDAERLRWRVRDVDRFDVLPVRKAQQELRRSINGTLHPFDHWRGHQDVGCETRPQIAGQIAHLREISDAALMNPLKNLTCVEPRMPQLGECPLELSRLGLCDVDAGIGGHGRTPGPSPGSKGEFSLYYVGRCPSVQVGVVV